MTVAMTQNKQITELSAIEKVVVQGDLSPLTAEQRVTYYKKVCESAGLNPFTKPFEYIVLNGKLTLYAKKDCTEQLRKLNGISIVSLEDKLVDDIYIVTAKATTKDGRTDSAKGAVVIGHLKGEQKANAIMKAETKAKRRVTLSISGMGFCDESEVDSIPNAKPVEIDLGTGELNSQSKEQNNSSFMDTTTISEDMANKLCDLLDLCSPEYKIKFHKRLVEDKKIDSLYFLPLTCYEATMKSFIMKSTEYQNHLNKINQESIAQAQENSVKYGEEAING